MKAPTVALDSYSVLADMLSVVAGAPQGLPMACRTARASQFGSQYLPGSEATTSVPPRSRFSCSNQGAGKRGLRRRLSLCPHPHGPHLFPGPSQLFWPLLASPTPPVLTPTSYMAPQSVTCCCHPHTLVHAVPHTHHTWEHEPLPSSPHLPTGRLCFQG